MNYLIDKNGSGTENRVLVEGLGNKVLYKVKSLDLKATILQPLDVSLLQHTLLLHYHASAEPNKWLMGN